MRVEVYRNLHNQCWSVRALSGPDKGRVIEHSQRVVIRNPEFVVQPAGNRKAREEGRKNVHAFVRGEQVSFAHYPADPIEVSYNPYRNSTFVDAEGNPVYTGHVALLNQYGKVQAC